MNQPMEVQSIDRCESLGDKPCWLIKNKVKALFMFIAKIKGTVLMKLNIKSRTLEFVSRKLQATQTSSLDWHWDADSAHLIHFCDPYFDQSGRGWGLDWEVAPLCTNTGRWNQY